HEHIQHDDPATVATELRWHLERLGLDPDAGPALTAIVEVQRERSHTLVEMAEQSAFLFREVEEYDAKAVKKHMKARNVELLADVRERLAAVEDWTAEAAHGAVKVTVEANEVGFGKVAQPIRIAVTGATVSPSIDKTLLLLGRDNTLARIDAALAEFGESA